MFLQHIINENDICNEINDYLNFFDHKTWQDLTGISEFRKETDSEGSTGYVPADPCANRNVIIALNICTYHRTDQIKRNIDKLLQMKFFNPKEAEYYGHLHAFVVDNGSELENFDSDFVKLIYNRNTGGSGGFQRGLEEIRNSETRFTHVIFMDDDVDFLPETFYRLYALLKHMKSDHFNRSIVGRMFCQDKPSVQYTAAEVWNYGDLRHVGLMQDMVSFSEKDQAKINDAEDAEYGGWWFCCYPYEFCRDNDVMPFFLHCDDVEYGLRFMNASGGVPIILNGIQVWHETYVYRQNPIIQYYDTRNPLFVNEKYRLMLNPTEVFDRWFSKITDFHVKGDYASEYYAIMGMLDFLKGMDYLYRIDPEKKHKKLCHARISKIKNSILWRIVKLSYKNKLLQP